MKLSHRYGVCYPDPFKLFIFWPSQTPFPALLETGSCVQAPLPAPSKFYFFSKRVPTRMTFSPVEEGNLIRQVLSPSRRERVLCPSPFAPEPWATPVLDHLSWQRIFPLYETSVWASMIFPARRASTGKRFKPSPLDIFLPPLFSFFGPWMKQSFSSSTVFRIKTTD